MSVILNVAAVWAFLGLAAVLVLAAVNRQRGPALVFALGAMALIAALMAMAGDF